MSEALEIKRDGAEEVKNSGRSRGVKKGDAVLEPFLVDYKEYSEGFTVSRAVWRKISTDAWTNGRREPLLKLVLGAEDPEDKTKIRLFVVGEAMFHEMLQAWVDRYVN
jgi:hypothetical protein